MTSPQHISERANTGLCQAMAIRDAHPGHSFTIIGYNTLPPHIQERYLDYVNVEISHTIRGPYEKHTCKCCKQLIYSEIHR